MNNEPQLVRADQYGGDNSFYDPKKDTITVGKGGVDDGEDLEVIWHELGHAIQDDQVPGFGVGHDANSMGEGFGDYWAFTMSEPLSGGFDPACIADWDSVSYTVGDAVHCLRRVDLDLTVDDQTGRIHHDGQIWSRALYDIHNALGRETADTIILQAQFDFGVDPSFAEAAEATIDAAETIAGHGAAIKVRKAFEDREISSAGRAHAASSTIACTIAATPATPRTSASHRRRGLRAVATAATRQPSPTRSSVT